MSDERTIEVSPLGEGDPAAFEVRVREAGGESRYRVTLSTADYARLSGGRAEPAAFVEAAFVFLLDREPKESILASFDISVIPRYFPEFESEIGSYLRA